MNENQLKTGIFILKAIDTILMTVLLAAVAYTIFYVEEKQFMIFVCLVVLALVGVLGRFSKNKIAVLAVQLQILQRDKKKEEQRTIMGTRHTTARATRTTAINTNPATKK
jgi:hypothetical protein